MGRLVFHLPQCKKKINKYLLKYIFEELTYIIRDVLKRYGNHVPLALDNGWKKYLTSGFIFLFNKVSFLFSLVWYFDCCWNLAPFCRRHITLLVSAQIVSSTSGLWIHILFCGWKKHIYVIKCINMKLFVRCYNHK